MLRRCACLCTRWQNIGCPCGRPIPPRTQLVQRNSRRFHESRHCIQNELVPLRKRLKDAKRSRKSDKTPGESNPATELQDSRWELTVGIEIHAQLNTASKLFSGTLLFQLSKTSQASTSTVYFKQITTVVGLTP